MALLTLKRQNVPLDRDVIALFEAGEEGTTRVGIQFMANQHFPTIDAEFCFAEGGGVTRQSGQVKFASVQTLEKIPRAIQLTARGVAGHGSVPLQSNSIVHLSDAVAKVGKWVAADQPERDHGRVLQAAGDDLVAGGSRALSQRAQPRSEGERRGRRVLPRQRAAPRVDAADLGVAEHVHGRLPRQRHPVRGDGDARRAHAARRRSEGVSRAGQENRQRSVGRSRLRGARRAARRHDSPRTPKRSPCSRPTSRSTTRRSRCRR